MVRSGYNGSGEVVTMEKWLHGEVVTMEKWLQVATIEKWLQFRRSGYNYWLCVHKVTSYHKKDTQKLAEIMHRSN